MSQLLRDPNFLGSVALVVVLLLLARDWLLPLDQWSVLQRRCPACVREELHQLCHRTGGGEHLDSVGDPLFNVREAAKQCEALEDHLEHPHKRCMDCIRKHFLMIEVLLEEAISLDRHSRYQALLCGKPNRVRAIISRFNEQGDYNRAAQDIRTLRKQFVNASFTSI